MALVNYTQLSDEELVKLHLENDEHAFSAIFKKYYSHLWSVAIRNTNTIHDAEDALQDAMLKAHKVLATFQWKSSLSSWLHRIVVNACIDRIRSNQRAPVSIPDYVPVERYIATTEDKETVLLVRNSLTKLSPEHREVIQLLDIEGYSLKEAAEILDLPVGTIKSRSGRARAKLLEILGDSR